MTIQGWTVRIVDDDGNLILSDVEATHLRTSQDESSVIVDYFVGELEMSMSICSDQFTNWQNYVFVSTTVIKYVNIFVGKFDWYSPVVYTRYKRSVLICTTWQGSSHNAIWKFSNDRNWKFSEPFVMQKLNWKICGF